MKDVRSMKLGRVAAFCAAVVLVWVGVFGGEYSTFDWLTLRRQVADERQAVLQLRATLDSLGRLTRALETSPSAQERAAREQFGMIRDGEILYRLVPATPPHP
jgi:cell division protein FtsB